MGKIRNTSTLVDKHPQRPEIEAALAANVSLLKLERRYGIDSVTLCRHRQRMRRDQPELFRALIAADWKVSPEELKALYAETSDGWLKNLRAHHAKLTFIFDRNLEAGNDGVAAQISAQLAKYSEQIGRAVHQLGADTIRIQQNVMVLPEVTALRMILMEELREAPELKARVVARLQAVADGGAGILEHAA
ncbi:hypothetical protein [Methylobacterium sp. J-070]|uniref:hypothetical protein n=1 Tax=Methylobacterium sp. J-070 TaxID=2836650 RepID=UPI001FBB86A3|nr:hypothetical protein [Methylobacterium sp. J-070]MCJ2048531.1 hypothetical protein [Methylobacterium sp. J-070]